MKGSHIMPKKEKTIRYSPATAERDATPEAVAKAPSHAPLYTSTRGFYHRVLCTFS